ncbi:hypothetical protein THAOC_26761, partial [Thalassiosira oceanica]
MRILFSSLLLAAPDLARAARTESVSLDEYRDPYDPAPAAVEVEDATGVGGGSGEEVRKAQEGRPMDGRGLARLILFVQALCDPDLINEIVQSAGDWWPTPRISMTLEQRNLRRGKGGKGDKRGKETKSKKNKEEGEELLQGPLQKETESKENKEEKESKVEEPLQQGIATYYGGGDACGFVSLPTTSFPFGHQAATGGSTFNNGYGCGACFEVTCQGSNESPGSICSCDSSKKVVVQVKDSCPECVANHFDMNIASFNEITSTDLCGVIKTTYRRVNCDFQGDIKIRSAWFSGFQVYGLQIYDVAGYGALDSVKLRQASDRESGQMEFDIHCNKSGAATSYW